MENFIFLGGLGQTLKMLVVRPDLVLEVSQVSRTALSVAGEVETDPKVLVGVGTRGGVTRVKDARDTDKVFVFIVS